MTSKPADSTPQPSSHLFVKATGQQGSSKQAMVEDDVDLTPTPTPVKTPSQNPLDSVKSNIRPSQSLSAPYTAQTPASIQDQVLTRTGLAPARPKSGASDNAARSLPQSSGKGSPTEVMSQPRRSLEESVSRHSSIHPTIPEMQPVASAASPPHSPRLHGYNPYSYPPGYMGAPPFSDSQRSSPAPPPPHVIPPIGYGYMPMMTGGPASSMYGNPYYGMPFSAPAEPMMQNNEHSTSPHSNQDEHQQLLEKVAGVLPDINRLLHNYKETHGQLSTKELLAKQADMSHNEELNKVKVELDATKQEYEKVIQNLVGERHKLERELTEARQRVTTLVNVEADSKAIRIEAKALQVEKKELHETLDAVRRSKEEIQGLKLAREKEIESLKKMLQAEKELHHRNVANVKEQAKSHLDLKQTELHKAIDEHKTNSSNAQLELTSLLLKHNSQKKDLEIARSAEADYKRKLDGRNKEVENTLARHSQQIGIIKTKHEEERERLALEGEERVVKMGAEQSIKEKEWEQKLQKMGAELESEKAENQRLLYDVNAIRKTREAEKLQKSTELVTTLALWRTKSEELQQQNQNLDRILQGLGYATEIKSKGDGFL